MFRWKIKSIVQRTFFWEILEFFSTMTEFLKYQDEDVIIF